MNIDQIREDILQVIGTYLKKNREDLYRNFERKKAAGDMKALYLWLYDNLKTDKEIQDALTEFYFFVR